jgi:hypothetical protein
LNKIALFLSNINIDSLLIDQNEYHSNISNNDGTTTNGDLSLLCCVCQDRASGRHYGVLSCEVNHSKCSILSLLLFSSSRVVKDSLNEVYVNKYYTHVWVRKIVQLINLWEIGDRYWIRFSYFSLFAWFRCQYCRLQKCLQVGMRIEAVQNERRPYTNKHNLMNMNNQRVRKNWILRKKKETIIDFYLVIKFIVQWYSIIFK